MSALFLKNATLTVDATDASDDADNVEFTPTSASATWTPISGKVQQESGATSWVMTANIAQDYTAGSLFMRLLTETDPFEVVLKPRGTAPGPTITATVVPTPAKIGGGIGALSASVTLLVNGKPAVTPAA